MIGVILAAGRGTRLWPITRDRSKAMVPVAGRPLIARVMDVLRAGGIREFVVVVAPEDREIEPYLERHADPAERVRCVVQDKPSGTAHALGCATAQIAGDFVLSACDSVTEPDTVSALIAAHHDADADITLGVMEVEPEAVARSAAVEVRDGRVRRIVEKPAPGEAPSTTIALPLYACSHAILELLPQVAPSVRGEYELADLFQLVIHLGGTVAYRIARWRLQVSTPADLLALNLHYLAQVPTEVEGRPDALGDGSRLEPPAVIGEGVRIGSACRIGPNVYLEGPSTIGDDVELRDSVVLRGVTIASRNRIAHHLLSAAAEPRPR